MPRLTLDLDEQDFAAINREIAHRQARALRWPETNKMVLPDGESCIAGALIAEAIRDLEEYRAMYAGRNL